MNEDAFKNRFEYLKKRGVEFDVLYKVIFAGKGSFGIYELKNARGEFGLKIPIFSPGGEKQAKTPELPTEFALFVCNRPLFCFESQFCLLSDSAKQGPTLRRKRHK